MKQKFMVVKKVAVAAPHMHAAALAYEGAGLEAGILGPKNIANANTGKKSDGQAFSLEIETDELDQKQAARLKTRDDIYDLVPGINMSLIAPKEVSPVTADAGQSCWGRDRVGVPASQYTGKGIVVAVLDTGIHKAHMAFANLPVTEEDFVGEGNGDNHGHGTHCAGTIAGKPVQGTAIGIAPGISGLLAGKVLGANGGSSEQIIGAIDWAVKKGAHVISMSLGMDFPGYVKYLTESEGMPVDLATSRGLEAYRKNIGLFEHIAANYEYQSMNGYIQPMVMVAASGNESKRGQSHDFRIDAAPPAISKGMISVAAIGEQSNGLYVAPFSNTGAILCAPGVNIISASPGTDSLATMSGTSMATPHVAGIAALWAEQLISQNRFNYTNLRTKILASCKLDGLLEYEMSDFGSGMITAP